MSKLKQTIREELAALLDEERPDPFEKIIGPDPNKSKKSYPAKPVKKKKKPVRVHPDGTPYEETGGCPDDGAGDPAHCYESMQQTIQEELAAMLQEVSPTADAPKADKPKKTVKGALAKARKTAEKHSSRTGAPGKGSSAAGKAKVDPVAIAKDVATLAVPGGAAVKGAKTAAKVYKAAKGTKAASKAAKTAKKAKAASKTSKARERARSETREQAAAAKEAAKPGDTKEYKKQLNKLPSHTNH